MVYINDIKETFLDFPNDEDQAVIVFFEGCSHNCEDCHNKELQVRNKAHGIEWSEAFESIIDRCIRVKTNKIVFSGGDPFFKKSPEDLYDMLNLISSLEDDNYEVCVYTGSTIEQVEDIYNTYGTSEVQFPLGLGLFTKSEISFYHPTYLKCGKFNKHLLNPDMGKSDDSFILASSNQNFYRKETDDNFAYKCISIDGILKFR